MLYISLGFVAFEAVKTNKLERSKDSILNLLSSLNILI